jgi:hypothetical protein
MRHHPSSTKVTDDRRKVADIRYVDWVDRVLDCLGEAAAFAAPRGRPPISIASMGSALGVGEDFVTVAVDQAVEDLAHMNLAEVRNGFIAISELGELAYVEGLRTAWTAIASDPEEPAAKEYLVEIVSLSERPRVDLAYFEPISERHLSGPGEGDDGSRLCGVLLRHGLIAAVETRKPRMIRPTYRGVVWAVEADVSIAQSELESILSAGPSTNLATMPWLNSASMTSASRFVVDCLALTNTRSAGPRYLVMVPTSEAAPDRRAGPPTDDEIDRVLGNFVVPRIRYSLRRLVGPEGECLVLKFTREAANIPHRTSAELGHVARDAMYVRHGGRSEIPTAREGVDLVAEGDQARSSLLRGRG